MSIKDSLKRFIDSKKEQMQRGMVVTQQMKAEKLRKKNKKIKTYEPGTIRYGLTHKQKTISFMRDVYEKRKNKREEKNKSN